MLKNKPVNAGKPWSEEDIEKVYLLFSQNKTQTYVAEELQRTIPSVATIESTVKGVLQQGSVDNVRLFLSDRSWSPNTIEAYISMWKKYCAVPSETSVPENYAKVNYVAHDTDHSFEQAAEDLEAAYSNLKTAVEVVIDKAVALKVANKEKGMQKTLEEKDKQIKELTEVVDAFKGNNIAASLKRKFMGG